MAERFRIVTERLVLRPWRSTDGDDVARLNADPEVMSDLGGPLDRRASDAKLERYREVFDEHGLTRWVVAERRGGAFLGYCGVASHDDDHPLGSHFDIGWRLSRAHWGRGIATEAARAALLDAFERVGCDRILAYTEEHNVRSVGVIRRLGLVREPELDFEVVEDGHRWSGQVWGASRVPPSSAGC
ncbi:MAG: GNAT family N-acetyltransferase [Actinomycetota bacterium]